MAAVERPTRNRGRSAGKLIGKTSSFDSSQNGMEQNKQPFCFAPVFEKTQGELFHASLINFDLLDKIRIFGVVDDHLNRFGHQLGYLPKRRVVRVGGDRFVGGLFRFRSATHSMANFRELTLRFATRRERIRAFSSGRLARA